MQLYCTSDLRKYKRVKEKNGNRQIKTAHGIKLKSGFELHRKFLEANDYGRKIYKKEIPTKLIAGNGNIQEGSTE